MQDFGRDLRACVPTVENVQERVPGQKEAKIRVYRGITLATVEQTHPEEKRSSDYWPPQDILDSLR